MGGGVKAIAVGSLVDDFFPGFPKSTGPFLFVKSVFLYDCVLARNIKEYKEYVIIAVTRILCRSSKFDYFSVRFI